MRQRPRNHVLGDARIARAEPRVMTVPSATESIVVTPSRFSIFGADLATLAHELRNPLAPIRTGVEVIRRTGMVSGDAARISNSARSHVSSLTAWASASPRARRSTANTSTA